MRRLSDHLKTFGGRGATVALAGLALALAGCVGGESSSGQVQTNTPAQIAQESADNYNDNVNGLITGATLQHWIDDWQNNRPQDINGRLIILQVNTGPEGMEYITPKPMEGVLSYHIDVNRLTQVRSNGVIETVQMVPDGAQVDAFLRDYDIDPNNDMVVCAMGTGGAVDTMRQGRCWYMFRYWGTAQTNLAALNGGASHPAVMGPGYLGSTVTCDEPASGGACLPRNGRVSVRDLPEDNISLQATLQDVIAVAEGRQDAFLWDARSANEYTAWPNAVSGKYRGIDFRRGAGTAAMQGHPNNAVLLPYLNLLVANDGSFRYKDKATLAAYMNGQLVDGAQFERYDAGSLIPLGMGTAYQTGQTVITYCETTFRAMVTGFASAAILGLPNRFYDGATVEWNSLAGGVQDRYGSFPLPADSPWRTDLLTRGHFEYNTPDAIAPVTIQDPFAGHTNAVTTADRAYRFGLGVPGTGNGDGGGVAPPANPCGG